MTTTQQPAGLWNSNGMANAAIPTTNGSVGVGGRRPSFTAFNGHMNTAAPFYIEPIRVSHGHIGNDGHNNGNGSGNGDDNLVNTPFIAHIESVHIDSDTNLEHLDQQIDELLGHTNSKAYGGVGNSYMSGHSHPLYINNNNGHMSNGNNGNGTNGNELPVFTSIPSIGGTVVPTIEQVKSTDSLGFPRLPPNLGRSLSGSGDGTIPPVEKNRTTVPTNTIGNGSNMNGNDVNNGGGMTGATAWQTFPPSLPRGPSDPVDGVYTSSPSLSSMATTPSSIYQYTVSPSMSTMGVNINTHTLPSFARTISPSQMNNPLYQLSTSRSGYLPTRAISLPPVASMLPDAAPAPSSSISVSGAGSATFPSNIQLTEPDGHWQTLTAEQAALFAQSHNHHSAFDHNYRSSHHHYGHSSNGSVDSHDGHVSPASFSDVSSPPYSGSSSPDQDDLPSVATDTAPHSAASIMHHDTLSLPVYAPHTHGGHGHTHNHGMGMGHIPTHNGVRAFPPDSSVPTPTNKRSSSTSSSRIKLEALTIKAEPPLIDSGSEGDNDDGDHDRQRRGSNHSHGSASSNSSGNSNGNGASAMAMRAKPIHVPKHTDGVDGGPLGGGTPAISDKGCFGAHLSDLADHSPVIPDDRNFCTNCREVKSLIVRQKRCISVPESILTGSVHINKPYKSFFSQAKFGSVDFRVRKFEDASGARGAEKKDVVLLFADERSAARAAEWLSKGGVNTIPAPRDGAFRFCSCHKNFHPLDHFRGSEKTCRHKAQSSAKTKQKWATHRRKEFVTPSKPQLSIKYPRDLPLATRPSDLSITLHWPGTPLPPRRLPQLDSHDGIDDSNRREGYAIDGKKKQLIITVPAPPSDAPRSPGYSPSSPSQASSSVPPSSGTTPSTASGSEERTAPFADTPFMITILWEKKKVLVSPFHFRTKNKTATKKVAIIRRKKVIDGNQEQKKGGKRSSESSDDEHSGGGGNGGATGGNLPPPANTAAIARQGTKRRAASPPPTADQKKKGKGANDSSGATGTGAGGNGGVTWSRLPSLQGGGEQPLPDDTDMELLSGDDDNGMKRASHASLSSSSHAMEQGRRREMVAVLGSYGLIMYCFMLLLTDIRVDTAMVMYTLFPACALLALARLLMPGVASRAWNGCLRTVSAHSTIFRIGLALSCIALAALLFHQHNVLLLTRGNGYGNGNGNNNGHGSTTGHHFTELSTKSSLCDKWTKGSVTYQQCMTDTAGLPVTPVMPSPSPSYESPAHRAPSIDKLHAPVPRHSPRNQHGADDDDATDGIYDDDIGIAGGAMTTPADPAAATAPAPAPTPATTTISLLPPQHQPPVAASPSPSPSATEMHNLILPSSSPSAASSSSRLLESESRAAQIRARGRPSRFAGSPSPSPSPSQSSPPSPSLDGAIGSETILSEWTSISMDVSPSSPPSMVGGTDGVSYSLSIDTHSNSNNDDDATAASTHSDSDGSSDSGSSNADNMMMTLMNDDNISTSILVGIVIVIVAAVIAKVR